MWRRSHRGYIGGIRRQFGRLDEGIARVGDSARCPQDNLSIDTRFHPADPDQLFVRGAAQRKAAVICRHCPVITACGADALDNRVEFGVWGGMTERQRRALLKQHPEVSSWSEFFAAQRKHRIVS